MTDGGWIMVLLITILIFGYVGSLLINPWARCSRCNGQPRRRGLIFSYASRDCSKCRGTGRQLRFGRRFIFKPPR